MSADDTEVERWTVRTGSTGAQLRRALDANQELAMELDQVRAERDRFVAAADELHGSWLDLKAEIASLRAQLAVRPCGNYHLTAKGLAATEPQPEPGEGQ